MEKIKTQTEKLAEELKYKLLSDLQVAKVEIIKTGFGSELGLKFFFVDEVEGEIVVSVFFELEGDDNDEFVFTAMTTLKVSDYSVDVKKKGYGKKVILGIIKFILDKKYKFIRAVQVQRVSEGFWVKCGFVKIGNATNDFEYAKRN